VGSFPRPAALGVGLGSGLMAGTRVTGGSAVALRGRRRECAVFETLLQGVRRGRSGVLVVRGGGGGKTALLEFAVESASDVRALGAVGVESEM
jgi:hypothetical protein